MTKHDRTDKRKNSDRTQNLPEIVGFIVDWAEGLSEAFIEGLRVATTKQKINIELVRYSKKQVLLSLLR